MDDFQSLIPCTSDTTTLSKQNNKIFMIMIHVDVPHKLDYACNQCVKYSWINAFTILVDTCVATMIVVVVV